MTKEEARGRERRQTPGTSFTAPPPLGADAPLVDEDELGTIWGHDATRRAAWARELLMRAAADRGQPYDRSTVRYAVTRGPEELAAVWHDGGETVFVAPDGSVLRSPSGRFDPDTYRAFLGGMRTPVADFGPPPPVTGPVSRADLAAHAEHLARRAALDVLPRGAADLLAIGDRETYWRVREEDGELLAFRFDRGSHSEIARSREPAVILDALERALFGTQ
ncbi:hypothetical protein [Microbacterium sp.]|uniref:hypothetical protein n=1 Tax=Microbacterium sp. TaxID=51671 RepID=UPI002811BEE3|nr:hypothetical protein [Microbacterium sp.]